MTENQTHADEASAPKTDLKSMTLPELEAWVTGQGEAKFRAKQLYEWMHVHHAASWDEMTNLPKTLRQKLERDAKLTVLVRTDCRVSRCDGTQKYLFTLPDGELVESVLMRYHHGNSVCISSQVGCAMGCTFCASTLGGCRRSLTAAEMLDQVYRIAADTKERVSHVVVMGMGEPLENTDALLRFLTILSGPDGYGISQRNLTVSTCGIAPQILRLAKETIRGEKPQFTLALSLHASTQEKREKLMPVARRYPLAEVLAACRVWQESTGRRMTFEYALCAGENDSDADAKELAGLIRDFHGHVNLIPVNPVTERNYRTPDRAAVEAFRKKLENLGINVTIRRELGRDIDGACGQLRRKYSG